MIGGVDAIGSIGGRVRSEDRSDRRRTCDVMIGEWCDQSHWGILRWCDQRRICDGAIKEFAMRSEFL